MYHEDDKDIKIFTGSGNFSADEAELLAQDVEIQRANGNMNRAKLLGERISALTPENDNIRQLLGEKVLSPSVYYQIRVLMIFTAMTSISSALPVAVLSSAATSEMINCLIKSSKNFYDNISDGAAFTFYYLVLRKGVDVPHSVGVQFASLCGKAENEYYVNLGKTIYDTVLNDINKTIGELGFVF